MSRRGGRGTALGADRGLAAVRSDDRGPAHMPRALRPKLRPPPDGSWIGSRTTRLNREPTQTYAGNGRAFRSLTARGGGFLWIEDFGHRETLPPGLPHPVLPPRRHPTGGG